MATNVPPFNLGEIVEGLKVVIMEERIGGVGEGNVDVDRLMRIIPGPDFPTGGVIVPHGSELEYPGIRDLYTNGMGSIMMRGEAHIEEGDEPRTKSKTKKRKTVAGAKKKIIITSLPYQVCKASLLTKIAGLVNAGTVVGISDLRDESDRDGIRVVITVKNTASPRVVLNNLYVVASERDRRGQCIGIFELAQTLR